MSIPKKQKPHPAYGWILFLPVIMVGQVIIHQFILWLAKLTLQLFMPVNDFWAFYGKLSWLGSSFIFMVMILLFFGIFMICMATVLICPIPKLATWIYLSLMIIFIIIKIYVLYNHLYTYWYSIGINLITDIIMTGALLLLITKGDIKNEDSYFYRKKITFEEKVREEVNKIITHQNQ